MTISRHGRDQSTLYSKDLLKCAASYTRLVQCGNNQSDAISQGCTKALLNWFKVGSGRNKSEATVDDLRSFGYMRCRVNHQGREEDSTEKRETHNEMLWV